MRLTQNLGMLVLAIYLILVGLSPTLLLGRVPVSVSASENGTNTLVN